MNEVPKTAPVQIKRLLGMAAYVLRASVAVYRSLVKSIRDYYCSAIGANSIQHSQSIGKNSHLRHLARNYITVALLALLSPLAFGQTLTDSNQNVQAMRLRTCMIVIGADNGSALASADIAPQTEMCKIPVAATIQEVSLAVDNASSTTSAQLQIRHCTAFSGGICTTFSTTNILSGSLPAPASGAAKAPSCAKTSISQTCIDGTTSSGSITVSATAIAAGDYIDVSNGTADTTTKRLTIAVVFQVN